MKSNRGEKRLWCSKQRKWLEMNFLGRQKPHSTRLTITAASRICIVFPRSAKPGAFFNDDEVLNSRFKKLDGGAHACNKLIQSVLLHFPWKSTLQIKVLTRKPSPNDDDPGFGETTMMCSVNCAALELDHFGGKILLRLSNQEWEDG